MSKVAVAMSVYKSDTVYNLRIAIDSILKQSYDNFDFYISVDGEVTVDVKTLLCDYNENNDNVHITVNNINRGLATRLNEIIEIVVEKGYYDFLARMDADDISSPNRLSRQVEFMENNTNIDVLGSDVEEVSENGDVVFYKRMTNTHERIAKEIIKKCPFNHPTVMFKMNIFREGFRYKSELMNTQDYYLWVDLLSAGKIFANINEPLLKFRISNDFHSRRGLKKAVNDVNSRIYAFKNLDVLSLSNLAHTLFLFLLRLSPKKIKIVAYKYLR